MVVLVIVAASVIAAGLVTFGLCRAKLYVKGYLSTPLPDTLVSNFLHGFRSNIIDLECFRAEFYTTKMSLGLVITRRKHTIFQKGIRVTWTNENKFSRYVFLCCREKFRVPVDSQPCIHTLEENEHDMKQNSSVEYPERKDIIFFWGGGVYGLIYKTSSHYPLLF